MKTDIIGSNFTRKLSEFKNFRFEIENMVAEQSILSILSDPYEVTMKDINTTDLKEITVAHRDLNKSLYPSLKTSDADVIIVELLSELNAISKYNDSYYNTSSLELLNDTLNYTNLKTIDKFRAFQKYTDEFVVLLNQYEKVIFLKLFPKDEEDRQFLTGLYEMLESKVAHKLSLSIDHEMKFDDRNVPLEIYDQVNDDLRKFSSDNYHNQLLFDESLQGDKISVYVNYVEEREYFYELYKDGKPYASSRPTTSRYCEYTLSAPGKYRIRVNLTDNQINPRFTQTYEFHPEKEGFRQLKEHQYVEMPAENSLWMLDVILQHQNIRGIVGNAYSFPEGYSGYPVFTQEEITDDYIKQEELFDIALEKIALMNEESFEQFIEQQDGLKSQKPMIYEFLTYINTKKERHR